LLEKLFAEADHGTRDLGGLVFLQPCRFSLLVRPYGNKVFAHYLGVLSKQCWKEIQRQRAGKSNLVDVIRSESQPD
jgi:hypothetical protein